LAGVVERIPRLILPDFSKYISGTILGLKERREREKQARRESILAAARLLLHEKGINGASMNQIAKKAELGVATLYSYFKNKEDLFLVLQKEGLEILGEYIADSLVDLSDPAEKLKQIAVSFLDFSQKRKNYFYIINYFISTPEILFESGMKGKIDFQAERALSIAELVIQEGVDQGQFKKVNTKRSGFMFWGLVHGLTQYKKLETTILQDDDYTEVFGYSIDEFIASLSATT
jgi:AcrR family transcriptional regulator